MFHFEDLPFPKDDPTEYTWPNYGPKRVPKRELKVNIFPNRDHLTILTDELTMNPNPNIHRMPTPMEQLAKRLPIFDKSGFVIFIERPGGLKTYLKDLKLSKKPDDWSSNRGESRVFRFRIQAQQFQKVLTKLGYIKTSIASTDDVNSPTWR